MVAIKSRSDVVPHGAHGTPGDFICTGCRGVYHASGARVSFMSPPGFVAGGWYCRRCVRYGQIYDFLIRASNLLAMGYYFRDSRGRAMFHLDQLIAAMEDGRWPAS